jgi:hypothetical protein
MADGITAGAADIGVMDDGEIDGMDVDGGAMGRVDTDAAPTGLPAMDHGDTAADGIVTAMIMAALAGMAADGASTKVKDGAVVRGGLAVADGAAVTMIEIGSLGSLA